MIIKGLHFERKYDFSKFLEQHKETQIFALNLFVSKRHVLHCVEQALKAFAQKRNISKSPQLEFLLCLTGEKQVGKALKLATANKDAVLVCWGKDVPDLKEFKHEEVELKDKPDLEAIQKSATFWLMQ